ncbi:MAG: hypothetical protein KDA91_03385 [Planctomycetaceae bacterium]|nr:hypothetical protein [Planctomycetaceae bacterium]
MLDREEYVEQQYFFRIYRERLQQNVPSQEFLQTIQEELLATTRLPMAIDFLRTEILHSGRVSDAMTRLSHYFTPFQAFVMSRAEDDVSRFEQLIALQILEHEAEYRTKNPVKAGMFIFQFECVARNRLGYNDGLLAISRDPIYDEPWKTWIMNLRRDLGARELSEMVYAASAYYTRLQQGAFRSDNGATERVHLFGDQEGRIAKANIGRDPFYFFAALQRQLGYPAVPRSSSADETEKLPGFLESRLNKIEQRLKLLEMEQRGGIDLTNFYRDSKPGEPPKFNDEIPDLS